MPGTIRVVVGLLLALGAVGGMDTATDAELLAQCVISAIGLLVMYSGVRAMRKYA